jgi:hypothetical protein
MHIVKVYRIPVVTLTTIKLSTVPVGTGTSTTKKYFKKILHLISRI